jgi:predicted enzyme related to lactoylglutathione lyase
MPERSRLEHVNITVSDGERTAAMLMALFGWRVRWRGLAADGGRTIHVGEDDTYVAVYQPVAARAPAGRFAKGAPLNHIGVVVDDLDATERKAESLGLAAFSHGDYEPGRRFYLFDPDGVELEIVSYAPAPR